MVFPFVALALASAVFFLSRRVLKAPLPQRPWRLFDHPEASYLSDEQGQALEGIYHLVAGKHFFGNQAVIKWTHVIRNGEKKFFVSIFLEKHAGSIICEAKQFRNKILLKGFWTKQTTAGSGDVRLVIHPLNGGYRLVKGMPLRKKTIRIKGWYSKKGILGRRVVFRFLKNLKPRESFQIIGHRGGGRNADYYPFSENSLRMIRFASVLGASGVELDVILSKDKVPVVFHDPVISYRSVENFFLMEPVSNYTVDELKKFTLKKGGSIPTLAEAMDVILQETSLELVWWDIKEAGAVSSLKELQAEYMEKIKVSGRKLEIYMGIATDEIAAAFKQLDGYEKMPSLAETAKESAEELQAEIWAPRWTDWVKKEEVSEMQQNGKQVFVWTVDHPDLLKKQIDENSVDGILTNVPTLLAYFYYAGAPKRGNTAG